MTKMLHSLSVAIDINFNLGTGATKRIIMTPGNSLDLITVSRSSPGHIAKANDFIASARRFNARFPTPPQFGRLS